MVFSTIGQFLSMGGYAPFVWPVYIFAAVVLFFSIYLPCRNRKKILKKLSRERL